MSDVPPITQVTIRCSRCGSTFSRPDDGRFHPCPVCNQSSSGEYSQPSWAELSLSERFQWLIGMITVLGGLVALGYGSLLLFDAITIIGGGWLLFGILLCFIGYNFVQSIFARARKRGGW